MPKKKIPSFDLIIVRRPGAPRLGKDQLVSLFRKAWTLLPASRRPDVQRQSNVAVDLLIVDDAEIESLNAAHLNERRADRRAFVSDG